MAQSNSSIDGNHFRHLDWRYTHCQAIQITKTDMSIDSCTDFELGGSFFSMVIRACRGCGRRQDPKACQAGIWKVAAFGQQDFFRARYRPGWC